MRFFRRQISVLLTVLLCASPVSHALDISAKSAVLYDPVSGRVLYEKDADKKMPIASTTKIMTALVAIENSDISEEVEIKYESTLAEGSSMYLKAGEILTLKDLLYGLMLSSGNDAALAIADYCGKNGGVSRFIEMMNRRAEELGLINTHFSNPNGLDAKDHFSSAGDLAAIAAAAMENEIFAEIVGTKTISAASRYLRNHNKLLWTYDGAVGIKTGFTKTAGRTLVSAAQRGGRRLIAVTLNAPGDWSDHTKMFDYGFSEFPLITLTSPEIEAFNLHIISGVKNNVEVRPESGIHFPLSDSEAQNIRRVVLLPRFVYAPLKAGEQVGLISYFLEDKLIGETPITITEDILEITVKKPGFFKRIFGK